MPESDGQLEAGAPEAAPFNMFGAVLAVNLMRQLGSIDTFNEQKARLEDKLYAMENVMLSVPTELLNPRDRAHFKVRGENSFLHHGRCTQNSADTSWWWNKSEVAQRAKVRKPSNKMVVYLLTQARSKRPSIQ